MLNPPPKRGKFSLPPSPLPVLLVFLIQTPRDLRVNGENEGNYHLLSTAWCHVSLIYFHNYKATVTLLILIRILNW